MILFNDTDLFTVGTEGKKTFDLQNLELMHMIVLYLKKRRMAIIIHYCTSHPEGNTKCQSMIR